MAAFRLHYGRVEQRVEHPAPRGIESVGVLGMPGEARVNVLRLNQALAQLS